MNTCFRKIVTGVFVSLIGLFLLGNTYTKLNAASLLDGIPPFPDTVEVEMHELDAYGNLKSTLCTPGNKNYGCTAFCNTPGNDQCAPGIYPVKPYPYASSKISVPIETYYLLDVVSQEMNPAIYGEPVALHAQAIAARSYMGWHINNSPSYNNSNSFQVFVPYKFDILNPSAEPLEPDTVAPCTSDSLNAQQRQVCDAIASRNYIARAENNPDHRPAFAEFFSDVQTETRDHPELNRFPYLTGVKEPISTACDSGNNGVNYAGMSQRGAVRWAKGNQCAENENQPWPVRWEDYRQILVHYYTGIDILDAGSNKVAPDDRWNLLWHDNFGLAVGAIPVLENAHLYPLRLQIQNTSVSDWTANEITLGYQWTVRGADPNPANWLPLTTLAALEKGASTPDRGNSPLTVLIPAPCGTGDYTLHLDVGRNGAWFSTANWPDARIDVTVQLSVSPAEPGRGYYTDGLGALYYNDQDDEQWQIGGPITWPTFSPPIVFSATEAPLNFDWDVSPPPEPVHTTFWSAIWEGNLYVPQTGQYRFYLGGLDDGGRLIIDGIIRIESWVVQGPHEYFSPPLNLTQGLHPFRVEYAQGPGSEAGLSVCWEGPNFAKEVINASGPITGQPTPTPFMTPTPLPSATPTPTATITLVPTPTPWWGWWSAAEEAALQDEPLAVREEYSTLLSRVRDEVMLPDPKGDAYIRLVYRHAPEITALLLSDASLRQETRALMLEVRPMLEDLLARKKEGAQLSADWVKRTLVLLENIEKKSSPALKAEIRWWRARLPRFVGKTGREIWEMLPPRQAGKLPQIEGSPEELVLQSISAEDARAFGRLLSQVRDEVMRPRRGSEVYILLVYRYTPEVVSILLNDEVLRKEAESLLLEARPGLEFWLGQHKETWRFSDAWVKRVDVLLAKLAEKGGPELRAEAIWWQERVQNWAGMTPQEVWESLLLEPRVQSGQ